MKNNKADVMNLLGLDEAAYDMNVLEYSYLFLELKGYNSVVIENLHQTGSYWVWWRNQFAIADAFFLNIYKVFKMQKYSRATLRGIYGHCHVNSNIFPGSIIVKINKKNTIKI